MTSTDVAVVTLGLVVIVTGCTTKTFYYGKHAGPSDKPAPLWFGRLVSIIVGSMFVLGGLRHLFID
jgi:hypothetical protein